ncbi:MAG: hypothetical protein EAX95_11185 [Candidatus Thorarchaeota archaeon]|nr:hypothetical protein [Candidatus Thorarchaeota archaeon]
MTEEKPNKNKQLPPLSNKSLLAMLVCLAFGWLAGQLATILLFPGREWAIILSSAFAGIVFIAVMMGFTIYSQRLRDERTILISDKATRNGFAFVFFIVPAAIIALSATDVSTDVSLALVLVWVGAVAVAAISSFYYYRK